MTSVINLNLNFSNKRSDSNFLKFLIKSEENDSLTYILTQNFELSEFYNTSIEIHQTNNTAIEKLYKLTQKQLQLFNRYCENNDNWVCPGLYQIALQHLKYTKKLDKKLTNEILEETSRMIHRSLNICLNDRNPNYLMNKQLGIYALSNLLFRIYSLLNNHDMNRNLVKVLESRNLIIKTCGVKSIMMEYYYNLGKYYSNINLQIDKSIINFNKSIELCPINLKDKKLDNFFQNWKIKILKLLIPIKLLNKEYPNFQIINDKILNTRSINIIQKRYGDLIKSFLTGNLLLFDKAINDNLEYYLENGIYTIIQKIKILIELQLIRRYYKLMNDENNNIIKLMNIYDIIYLSMTHNKINNNKEFQTIADRNKTNLQRLTDHERQSRVECTLARLISMDLIRGYISRGNGVIVLSKKEAFPRKKASSTTPPR